MDEHHEVFVHAGFFFALGEAEYSQPPRKTQ
jgi:hypothetical protein